MSSLIDKGKVTDKISDLFLDKYEVKANSDLTEFYKEILKIVVNEKSQSNWISVKDRLPEKDTCGRYLIHVKNMANYHHLPNNIIIAEWCFNDWIYGGWEFNYVTHWMPLPQIPESEDDAE